MIKAYYKWLWAHKILTVIAVLVLGVAVSAANGSPKTTQTPKNVAKPSVAKVATQSPPKTAPAQPISDVDKAKVVSILTGNDNHYAAELKQGQSILGTTQYPDGATGSAAFSDPNSAASKFSAYQKNPNPCGDLSSIPTFKQADAYYNADNEPNGIRSWQTDSSQMNSDLCQWVNKAVSWQISQVTTSELNTYADKVNHDLAVLANDVTDLQNNK